MRQVRGQIMRRVAHTITPLRFAVAASAVLRALARARGQGFLDQPIRVIVPTQAGGMADILSRVFAQKAKEQSDATVIKTGANGVLHSERGARAASEIHPRRRDRRAARLDHLARAGVCAALRSDTSRSMAARGRPRPFETRARRAPQGEGGERAASADIAKPRRPCPSALRRSRRAPWDPRWWPAWSTHRRRRSS